MTESQTVSKSSEKGLLSLYDAVIIAEPQGFPARPKELCDYDQLSQDKRFEISDRLFKHEDIQEYLDIKWSAELHNRTSFIYLYEILSTPLTQAQKDRVLSQMTKFKDAILSNDHPFPALCLNFKNYQFKETREKASWNEEE